MSNISRRQDQGLGKTAAGGSGGSFASHERGAAQAPAPAEVFEDEFADIRQDYWEEDAERLGLGEVTTYFDSPMQDIGIWSVDASRDEDGTITVSATMYENPVSAGALTEQQYNRGSQLLADRIAERYETDTVEIDNDTLRLHYGFSYEGDTVSPSMASDLIYERTKVVGWVNESDAGTYGSIYFYSDVQRDIDAGFFPGASDNGDFDGRTRDRAREAASLAVHGRNTDDFPQLSQLSAKGYCVDASAAADELRTAMKDVGDIRETRELMAQLTAE